MLQKRTSKKILGLFLLLSFWAGVPFCSADMSSTNYIIRADVIGSFGTRSASSGSTFELGDTGGEVGTGDSSSTTYKLGAGFWSAVGDDDVLIFNITQPIAALGTFDSSQVKYGTATFNVATNAQRGYVVEFSGSSLTSAQSKTISPLSSANTSSPGTEQFGFNLVANATPGIGVDPVGGYGGAASGYNTPDQFKFVPGDVIAQATGLRLKPTTPCRLSPTSRPTALPEIIFRTLRWWQRVVFS